ALVFGGESAVGSGVGREAVEVNPGFWRTFERCSKIAEPLLGCSLVDVLHTSATDVDRRGKLVRGAVIFAVEYTLAALWMSYGVRPSAVMGHGIGEYVAACLADVFSLEHA